MKKQFKTYCDEIKFIYDKDKAKLKQKISELSTALSSMENDKETSGDVVQTSIREVNMLYNQQIDYLQKELMKTKADASTRIVHLTSELNEYKDTNQAQEETITALKAKIKDIKYHNEISQKAATYKLEKTE